MSYELEPQSRGMSGGAKFALGCGVIVLLGMALVCGGGFFLFDKAEKAVKEAIEEMTQKVDAFAGRFEAQGYERVTGQVAEIKSDIQQPTVYTVQVFKLEADSEASLAVMAQVADIRGKIDGDLTFYGQTLVVHPDAVITGNVHVEMAQTFENKGTILGGVIRSEEDSEDTAVTGEESDNKALPEIKPLPGDVVGEDASVDDANKQE